MSEQNNCCCCSNLRKINNVLTNRITNAIIFAERIVYICELGIILKICAVRNKGNQAYFVELVPKARPRLLQSRFFSHECSESC